MTQFFQDLFNYGRQHIIALIVTGTVAFALHVIKKGLKVWEDHIAIKRKQIDDERIEQSQLRDGLLSLLRYRINRLAYDIKAQGFITLDEKTDLSDMMSAYEKLGGNGRTKSLFNEIITLKLEIEGLRNKVDQNCN